MSLAQLRLRSAERRHLRIPVMTTIIGVASCFDSMFFNPRFSPNGYISCVACHQPDRSFTDNLPRARGLAPVERNAIALQNLRLQRWYGWGGSSDSLWMASLRPILDPREIGSSAERVAFVIRTGDGVA